MTTYIGLIGGGNISETHARAARAIPDVQIAAVFGTNAENVNRLCREYGGTAVYRLREISGSPSDGNRGDRQPFGTSRRAGHGSREARPARAERKAARHHAGRADALIAEARNAGVKLGVFFQDRCKPDILGVKNAVDAGTLGRPILADARVKWYRPPEYYAKSRWRGTLALDGGGALINQAVHTLGSYVVDLRRSEECPGHE